MNYLLRPRIWPSFLASSGVGPCDVPFRYASEPTPCGCPARGASACAARGTPILFALTALRSVPQAGSQLRGLATAIHEISGLAICFTFILATLHPFPYSTGRILHHRGKVSNILLGSLILARQLVSSLCTVLNPKSIGPVPIIFW